MHSTHGEQPREGEVGKGRFWEGAVRLDAWCSGSGQRPFNIVKSCKIDFDALL